MKAKKKVEMKEGQIRFKHIKVEFPSSTLVGKGDDVMYGMPITILEKFKEHIEKVIAFEKSKIKK